MKTIRTILATFGFTTLLYGVFALVMISVKPAFAGRTIFQLFRETGFVTLVIGIGCVLSAVIMTVAIMSFRDEGSRKKHEVFDDEEDLDEFLEEETVPESRAAEADETWSSAVKFKQRRALKQTEESEEDPDDYYDDYEDEYEPQPIRMREPFREHRAEPVRQYETTRRAEPEPEPEPEHEPEPEPTPEPAPAPARPVIRSSFRPRAPEPPVPEEPSEDDMPEPEAYERKEKPSLKKCAFCGNMIDADSTFCIYCGKRV